MKKTVWIIFILLIVFGGAGLFYHQVSSSTQTATDHKKALYHCPMHPNFTSEAPGKCAICGMDLVKSDDTDDQATSSVTSKKEHKIIYYRNPMNPSVTSPVPMKDSMGMDYIPVYADEKESAESGVKINSWRQQLIGVKEDTVKKRPLAIEISTVGWVAHDTELYVAQEEYIQALKTVVSTSESTLASIKEQSQDLLASARQKLLHLGMSPQEIDALKASTTPQENLYFPTHNGKAWIYMTVYEYEVGLVKIGENVSADTLAYPGKIFKGKVTAITPVLDSESRSVRVRAEMEDKDGQLEPEMYVNARILVDLGVQLAVPEEAVLDSGTRKIVYVVKGNRFIATQVTVGHRAGGFYEVLNGLHEGEMIVTSGNFLIDSESRLNGAL